MSLIGELLVSYPVSFWRLPVLGMPAASSSCVCHTACCCASCLVRSVALAMPNACCFAASLASCAACCFTVHCAICSFISLVESLPHNFSASTFNSSCCSCQCGFSSTSPHLKISPVLSPPVVCCTACCSASCPLISARQPSLVTSTDCCCIYSCCQLWSLVDCTACCSFIRSSCAGCSCGAERKSISSATVSICLLSLWSLFDISMFFSTFIRSIGTVCSRHAAPFTSSPVGCCFSCNTHLASRSMLNALNHSLS